MTDEGAEAGSGWVNLPSPSPTDDCFDLNLFLGGTPFTGIVTGRSEVVLEVFFFFF